MELLKDKTYVLEYRSDISNWERRDNAKYLLDTNQSENIITQNYFTEDVTNLISKPLNKGKEPNYLIGTFSKLAGILPIVLYSDPEYLTKYPGGIHTEGILMVPITIYNQMLQGEPTRENGEKLNASPFLFVKLFTNILENKYGVEFSSEAMRKIYGYDLASQYSSQDADSIIKVIGDENNLAFVKHEDLITQLKKSNFSESTIDFIECTKSDTSYIDELLFNSREVNDENHHFNNLKKAIEPQNVSFSEEEKQEMDEKKLANLIQLVPGPELSTKVLNFLKELAEKETKNQIEKMGSENDVANVLEKKWVPLVVELPDQTLFKVALNDFLDTLPSYAPSLAKSDKFKHSVLLAMNKNSRFTESHRNVGISIFSQYHVNNLDRKESELLEKKEYQAKIAYFKACETGDLSQVKEILKNNNVNPTSKNNHALELAGKNGHVEVVDYLLNSTELKQNLSMKLSLVGAIISYDENVVAYLLKDEATVKKFDVLKNYKVALTEACKKNSKAIIENLISFPGTEKLINEKLLGFKALCSVTDAKVDAIKLMAETIIPQLPKTTDSKQELQNCFDATVNTSNIEASRYFIFDLNIQVFPRYRQLLQYGTADKFKDVEKCFVLREINEKLTQDFAQPKPEENEAPKSKKKPKV